MPATQPQKSNFTPPDLPALVSFPGDSEVKNSPAVQEMQVPSLSWEDPLEEETATYSSGESKGQRRAGYSPSGHKESDTTEQLNIDSTD